MTTSAADIRDFLAQHRIALVGLSRNPKDFSRILFHEMSGRGYDMVPVNPAARELEDKRCFAHVQEIQPAPDAVLVMTPAEEAESVVRDCLDAGVRRIWLHRAGGQGAVSAAALDLCRHQGMPVVAGYCPFMFLAQSGWIHRLHRFFVKLTGKLPR